MPPKRGKKKGKDEDFEDDEKIESKWANLLQEQGSEEGDAEEIYNKPNKAVYDYDFSNVKILDQKEPPKQVHKDKHADLTPEQKQELERMREKAKIDKAEKDKIKKEKDRERKKAAEALRLKELEQKEKLLEEEKKVQEEVQKNKNKQSSHWTIPISLLVFLILMMFLQYNKEIHEKLAKFKIEQQQNYYEVLEADEGATDSELKSKYKKLVLKYHPDRNPECQNCREKFENIMKAWEVLGDAAKRKSYDQNSGYVTEIKSASVTLTPKNYEYLVSSNRHVWMVQVFDSTTQYSRYFAQFWEQMNSLYGDVVKFGRVDVWHQEDMLSYIPYSFQIFPALYTYDNGYTQICDFDHQSPLGGMKRCIEEIFQKSEPKVVDEMPTPGSSSSAGQKIPVVLHGRLRASLRAKAINKRFENYYDFQYLNTDSPKREAFVLKNGHTYSFQFTGNTKKVFESYGHFLESFIVLEMSVCNFLSEFEERACALLFNKDKIEEARSMMPLSKYQTKPIPVVHLTDCYEQLNLQIDRIKKATDMLEAFDLGVYQEGRIDLGYLGEVDQLKPEEGELMYLQCRVFSWKEKLVNFVKKTYSSMISGQQK